MPRRTPENDDSFLFFVQRRIDERRLEITEAVMAGIDDHGRYRAEAGRDAGLGEASEILARCWMEFGTESGDE